MKLLTIVIPSYNTEKYIDECIPTFLESTDIYDDIEIIMVDDGSTDETKDKIEAYERNYPNVVRGIYKKNGGHGSTINVGISEAKGKYFKVVDGDDWVDNKELVSFISELKNIDSDVVVNNYKTVNMSSNLMKDIIFRNIEYGRVYKFNQVWQEAYSLSIHSLTYKTEFLKNNKIVLTENCYYEDMEYVLYPIPYIDTITFLSNNVYRYRVGTEFQSVNIKNAVRNIDMHYKIVKNIIDFYLDKCNSISVEKKKYLTYRLKILIRSQYLLYLKCKLSRKTKDKYLQFDNFLKKRDKNLYDEMNIFPVNLLRINFNLFNALLHPIFILYFKYRR